MPRYMSCLQWPADVHTSHHHHASSKPSLSEAACPVGKLRSLLFLVLEPHLKALPLHISGPSAPTTLGYMTIRSAPIRGKENKRLEQRSRGSSSGGTSAVVQLPTAALRSANGGVALLPLPGRSREAVARQQQWLQSDKERSTDESPPPPEVVALAPAPRPTSPVVDDLEVPPTPSTASIFGSRGTTVTDPSTPPVSSPTATVHLCSPPPSWEEPSSTDPADGTASPPPASSAAAPAPPAAAPAPPAATPTSLYQVPLSRRVANDKTASPLGASLAASSASPESSPGQSPFSQPPPAGSTLSDAAVPSEAPSKAPSEDDATTMMGPLLTAAGCGSVGGHGLASIQQDATPSTAAVLSHRSSHRSLCSLPELLPCAPASPVTLSRVPSVQQPLVRADSDLSRTDSVVSATLGSYRHSSCAMCGDAISGHVFMLDDLPFCTADCRLQACRTQVSAHANGGGAHPNAVLGDKALLARTSSVTSIASSNASSASGLYATFKSWL